MKRASYTSGKGQKAEAIGPTQRQLRAGELVRHALVEILREEEIHDEALHGVSITVTEVRCSPDLRHATIFVEPLGAGLLTGVSPEKVKPAIDALNRHAKFMRGVLGRMIDMKFTPALKFLHDESFNEASRLNALFSRPEVAQDLAHDEDDQD
ncbi:30S ribosome-binding factor RbfA [Asticcacaulis sp. ZE23SCel15]|uniref:30S ribosome-binding factor RbfA n=1 Tax=unclassified Asticcacaulis TaxID=2628350 RepID=UPI00226C9695|nr:MULTISPECIES: 30S ribosome-binding factor RbfA [unclassified Asticcacaulis]WAC47369.1 30S ribosome-binding factor RbfA [Asticcacaulis sp. SL142]WKL58241.1 30S ribosome-binding factor RbfA [Asticcacaulis sp. ZE23SCel15]